MNAKKNITETDVQSFLEAKDVEKRIEALSYEEALSLVEELLCSVEAGNLPLEKTIVSYEKGMLLVKHLRSLLAGAEARLKLLKEVDGELVTESID